MAPPSPSSPSPPPAKRPRSDPVTGLDVAGKLYYCRKSTLLSAGSSYFAARFGPGNTMDPEVDRVDASGREVYFIDRDGDIFRFVLEYLRTNRLPTGLGGFRENPSAWRALRQEAEFFALDGLSSLLSVTFTCSPERDGGKGILHWLGTNKGKEEYENPFKKKIVDVKGWFDWFDDESFKSDLGDGPTWGTNDAKECFVQFRPMPEEVSKKMDPSRCSYPFLFRCEMDNQAAVVIDFRMNAISPTHISTRYGGCCDTQCGWELEASNNEDEWIVLGRGREIGDQNQKLGHEKHQELKRMGEGEWMEYFVQTHDERKKRDNYCEYLERHYRHTWDIDNSPWQFFRYIRLKKESDEDEDRPRCFHPIGFEIYGHVHEE